MSFLESMGVDLVEGDLADPASCSRAACGVDFVYHAAAKVGDWGPWREFQVGCIDATARLAEAAADAGVARFVHISSTSAYGHPADRDESVNESEPMGQGIWAWDPYTRSKVESERVLGRISAARGLATTVIRPSWLYGERDRTTVARLVERLRAGRVWLLGPGDNPISAIYAGQVADAAILAAADPGSAGEAYNVTNQGFISQRDFLNLFAAACGAPPVTRSIPYRLVYGIGSGAGIVRASDPSSPAAARHALCSLVARPTPHVLHPQGEGTARVDAGRAVLRDHHAFGPVVSRGTGSRLRAGGRRRVIEEEKPSRPGRSRQHAASCPIGCVGLALPLVLTG